MNKTFSVMALLLMIGGLPALAQAQGSTTPTDGNDTASSTALDVSEHDQLAMMRASIRIKKRDFIRDAMELDEEESKKFWSVYQKYEAELIKLNDYRQNTIEDYAKSIDDISESKADEIVKRGFEYRKARLNLLAKYYSKFAKALDNRTAARFIQVENVLLGAGDVTIGTSIPMMPKVTE